jgi:hypothetical protein
MSPRLELRVAGLQDDRNVRDGAADQVCEFESGLGIKMALAGKLNV